MNAATHTVSVLQIATVKNYVPGLDFVNSSAHPDCSGQTDFSFEIKPDICVYQGDKRGGPTDVARVELVIEFKWDTCDDPFREPDDENSFLRNTKAAFDTAGQITAYAAAQLGSQFRTCVYSVLVVKDYARLIRWDRTGAVVSEAINYNHHGHLIDFFRRYSRAQPDLRGMDTTVSASSAQEEELAQKYLGLSAGKVLVKVAVPHPEGLRYYIALAPTAGPYTPPGRATRGFVAYDIHRKMKVYLKDSWRIDLPDIEQEGVIYQLLHDAHVRNIAPCSAAGDISNHATLTHTFINKSWACKLMIQLIPHRHYRLVLDTVGQSLTSFSSSFEMLKSVEDAIVCKCDEPCLQLPVIH